MDGWVVVGCEKGPGISQHVNMGGYPICGRLALRLDWFY